jgi:hypothetical protein
MLAEKCAQSARSKADPETVAELEAMASDLEIWANEAELRTQRRRPRPSAPAMETAG